VGDALAKSRKNPKVEGVVEKLVLGDGGRTIELHHLEKFEHSDGMLVAYLPKERILFTADIDIPAAGQPASSSIVSLLQNLDRLQIDFDRHVMVRQTNGNPPMSRAEMATLVQRSK
jgi:glyoxylase-like metal-dependent hydrolase (beta-lactamase superfamily II)